jgi:hypothetical protein
MWNLHIITYLFFVCLYCNDTLNRIVAVRSLWDQLACNLNHNEFIILIFNMDILCSIFRSTWVNLWSSNTKPTKIRVWTHVLWKIEQGISMFHVKYEDNKYIMVQVIGLIETKDCILIFNMDILCSIFRSTWVHPRLLVGFVLPNL